MKVLAFNRLIKQSYHDKKEGEFKDTINKALEHSALAAIRASLKHLSELPDKELLELCYTEEVD